MCTISNNLGQIHRVFEPANFSNLIRVIRTRYLEIRTFERYRSSIKTLIQYCYKFDQIYIREYVSQINYLESLGNELESENIRMFCESIPFEKIQQNGTEFL